MGERRDFRCREPSKTSSSIKIGMQNNRTIRCSFKRSTGSLSKVVNTLQVQKKIVFERSMSVSSILLGCKLEIRKRRKK